MNYRKYLITTLMIMLTICIAACSTSTAEVPTEEAEVPTEEVDVVAVAEEIARKYMAPVTSWDGPTEGPAAVPDKTIVGITCGMSSEGCARPIEGAIEAAELLGWEFVNCDPNFDPTQMAACVDMAITIKADGIFIFAISEDLIAEPLARARAEGIEVVGYETCTTSKPDGFSFQLGDYFEELAEAIANYQIWVNNGQAKTLLQTDLANKCLPYMQDLIAETVDESGGEGVYLIFSEAELTTTLPSRTVAEMQADPDINGLVCFGDAIFFTRPPMEEAGLLDSVFTTGYGLQSYEVDAIRDGAQSASVAIDQTWGGWAAMDSLNRLFAGEEPVSQNLPIRLFTEENIQEIPHRTHEEGGSKWDGDIDWRSIYLEIWGVNSD